VVPSGTTQGKFAKTQDQDNNSGNVALLSKEIFFGKN
jgi:hypothetical protein